MAKTRKSKADIILAGFKIREQRTIGDKRYLNKIYYENQEKFEKAYRKEYEKMVETAKRPGYTGSVENFKARFPNARVYAQSLIKNYRADFHVSLQESAKKLIQVRFGEARLRFENNLLTGLKSFGLYEDFMLYINEEFNPERLSYADGNYIYKTEKGKRVLIDVHNSPYSMELKVLGETESRVLGEKNG